MTVFFISVVLLLDFRTDILSIWLGSVRKIKQFVMSLVQTLKKILIPEGFF